VIEALTIDSGATCYAVFDVAATVELLGEPLHG
jgi:hypothetical protein